MPKLESDASAVKPPSLLGRVIHYSAYLPIVLAAVLGFAYVHHYGVNLLFWDEWDTVPILYERYANGTLTAADLWTQHNEHRPVFPQLVMLGLGLLTKGNVLISMVVTECLLLVILIIFVAAFRNRFGDGPILWFMAPMAFLVFSLRQCENMLWGFQIGFAMVAAASVLAFWCLSRLRNERYVPMLIVAAAAATVSAYSSSQGLLVWPVGAGQILVGPLARRKKFYLAAVWAALGILEWAAYFYDYVKPSGHPPLQFSWAFFFAAIGGALFNRLDLAMTTGFVFCIVAATMFALVLFKRQAGQNSFWLATMAMSAAIVGAITVGRTGFGADHALSSRYATFSIPLVAATYVLLIPRQDEPLRRSRLVFACAMLGVMLFGLKYSVAEGLSTGRTFRTLRQYGQTAVCTMNSQSNSILRLYYPDKIVLANAVTTLKKMNYSVFADANICDESQMQPPSTPALPAATRYAIDKYPFQVFGECLAIRGWAVDWPAGSESGEKAGGVAVVLDGVAHPTRYGIQDKAAATSLGNNKFLQSGFLCLLPAEDFRVGQHTISLRIATRDRNAVFETSSEMFEIKR